MPYSRFIQSFGTTTPVFDDDPSPLLSPLLRALFHDENALRHISAFLKQFGGMLLYNGAYGIYSLSAAVHTSYVCLDYFDSFRGYTIIIGRDWLGSLFAVDFSRIQYGRPTVLVFDINTVETRSSGMDIEQFHETLVIDDPDMCFDLTLYQAWQHDHPPLTAINQIVGYTIPLALGGSDDFSNMALTDLDVYWSLTGDIGIP
jgi:hypothetical protein